MADGDLLSTALRRYAQAEERERENILRAYEDLEFRAGNQWPEEEIRRKQADGRPILTFNQMPRFVRQVVNDIRLMRPSIKVVGVDDEADPDVAGVLGGLIRYIENRSDAQAAYYIAADQQVTAGVGHWQVVTEYAGEKTFDQELRIVPIDDGVSVLWDPDSALPTREDAMWCFQPLDITHDAFKARFPKARVEDFTPEGKAYRDGWFGEDYVRIARYWRKKPVKRRLALLPDGSIVDLTDEPEREAFLRKTAEENGEKLRVEDREGHKVTHCLLSAGEILEPEADWPGSFIPIVPVFGEEVRIGRRIVRHGMIRYAADPQRMFNYAVTLQTEAVALQPKAPFMVTADNIKEFEAEWQEANDRMLPAIRYHPDPKNAGAAPQRAQPPVSSQGANDLATLGSQLMKDVIGIQDAALGERSNETSGRAILARQGESDVGMYTYIDNFSRAIRHTGAILIDLIPKVYDSERVLRVMGEDGQVDVLPINREIVDPATGKKHRLNDVTVGAYDVVVQQGPGYTTQREEAKQGMLEVFKMAPDLFPLAGDLFAKAQDWPPWLVEKLSVRLKTLLPPQIQALEAEEAGEEPPPAAQPSPIEEAEAKKAMAEADEAETKAQIAKVDLELKQIELAMKKTDDAGKALDLADRMLNPQPVAMPVPGQKPPKAA